MFGILVPPAPVGGGVATQDPQATPDLRDVAPTLVALTGAPVPPVIVEGIYPPTFSHFILLNISFPIRRRYSRSYSKSLSRSRSPVGRKGRGSSPHSDHRSPSHSPPPRKTKYKRRSPSPNDYRSASRSVPDSCSLTNPYDCVLSIAGPIAALLHSLEATLTLLTSLDSDTLYCVTYLSILVI